MKTEATLEMKGKGCGFSSWYCLTEFVDFNVGIIKRLSYIDPATVRVFKVDHVYSHVVADHK